MKHISRGRMLAVLIINEDGQQATVDKTNLSTL
jgi:hypothetical protein